MSAESAFIITSHIAVASTHVRKPADCSRCTKCASARNIGSGSPNVLSAHVLKARSYSDGSVRDFGDMENNEQKIFKERQNTLNSWGVTSVVLHAISTHAANIEGNLADESVEVLKELLYGGNEAVQAKVGNFIRDIDKDNKFLLHMRQRMEHSHVAIKERKEKTSLR